MIQYLYDGELLKGAENKDLKCSILFKISCKKCNNKTSVLQDGDHQIILNFEIPYYQLPIDAQVYMIEEKEPVGTGKVFVGHAQECTLRGLEPLTEHIYRMRCKTLNETTATPWLTVYTKKEPISCEHLIRACFSSGL